MGSETHNLDILDGKWYKLYQRLLPNDSFQFVISRNREDVLNCRIENTFNEAFDYRFRLYQKIAQKPEVIKIDNTGSIEKAFPGYRIHKNKRKIVTCKCSYVE